MKCALFLTAVAVFVVNLEEIYSLQVDTMDTWKTEINLNNPSSVFATSGILKSHIGSSYTGNRNKTLFLSAPTGYSLLAAIRLLDLRPYSQDSLTLFENGTSFKPFVYSNRYRVRNRLYDSYELTYTFYAKNGKMGVTFFTGSSYNTYGYDGFELIYTVQADVFKCKYENFRCLNGRCIQHSLTCDGHNHCGDRSDQTNYSCFDPLNPNHPGGSVAGIVTGVVFLCIAVACCIFIIIRRVSRSRNETRIIHRPPPTSMPGYPPPFPEPVTTHYPPPPPPYSPYNQGVSNPNYH